MRFGRSGKSFRSFSIESSALTFTGMILFSRTRLTHFPVLRTINQSSQPFVFTGRIFFKALWVDIVSVWQPVENMIMVRWTIHGIPRVPWESRGRFDATSKYKLDKNGKIFEHRVHNIALNSPPKFQVLSMDELIQSIGCPTTPKPTYFEISSSYIRRILPLSRKYTGMSH